MIPFNIADEDVDDPIVWQCGSLLPSGECRVSFMRKSDEKRLVDAFGRAWLDAHIAEKEAEIKQWGKH